MKRLIHISIRQVTETLALLAIAICLFGCETTRQAMHPAIPMSAGAVAWQEAFESAELDPAQWQRTRANDFKAADIAIRDGRLAFTADTRGAAGETVKHLGLRRQAPIALDRPTEIAFTCDWNEQANGSYLAFVFYLAPAAVDTTAVDTKDWLRVAYIGVPPGKTGRLELARMVNGRYEPFFTEGWPQEQRQGRPLAEQQLRIRLGDGHLQLIENGEELWRGPCALPFDEAYCYWELRSHSNYPARTVYLDNITVRQAGDGEGDR